MGERGWQRTMLASLRTARSIGRGGYASRWRSRITKRPPHSRPTSRPGPAGPSPGGISGSPTRAGRPGPARAARPGIPTASTTVSLTPAWPERPSGIESALSGQPHVALGLSEHRRLRLARRCTLSKTGSAGEPGRERGAWVRRTLVLLASWLVLCVIVSACGKGRSSLPADQFLTDTSLKGLPAGCRFDPRSFSSTFPTMSGWWRA
jgi:hypothetical protein